ncbi:MAG: amidohydrolase family protein [Henriciella sp.]|nr:amidohydrolase family protein [Henriciella sp.]
MNIQHTIVLAALVGMVPGGCKAPEVPAVEQTETVEALTPLPALSGTEHFTILTSGTEIGALSVDHSSGTTVIDYEYRNNGRGPTLAETIRLDAFGFPIAWDIEGATTFGNKVDETFVLEGSSASWTDSTGSDVTDLTSPAIYVAQNASPYSLWLYARILLADADRSAAVLPGGTLQIGEMEDIDVTGPAGPETVTAYALSGISQNPSYIILDADKAFVGFVTPRFSALRKGYESEDEALRARAVEYSAERFESIQAEVARNYEGPVRIANVRVFDPESEALTEPVSVVFEGNTISAIEASDTRADGETLIDGAGGTLVAGMYEMHGHLGQNSALLNIAAGVTSVRDMGNSNDVLAELIEKIESGRIAGPRIIRSGFIEGKSPFSSNNGELVSTQEEAIEAVRRYGNGDFHQIKIYNSMKGEWVPAMIEEARRLGLRVTGHVPAFSNADQMIAAGYDEMTHINQVMLGWVLEQGEDTRTLLRLTALKRLPKLDIQDPRVQATINAMATRGIAIDPTLAIHEALLRSRNGEVRAGVVDYIDHMPVAEQRGAKTAWSDVSAPGDDEAYYQAFDKILETVTAMREAGILLVPGTDMGGSFVYHRELELYQQVGMTAPEILAWATQGMADYVEQGDQLGSIEPGKFADFFLIPGDPTEDLKAIKTISMVVKDGTVYFPSEIYPSFGIKPFTEAPDVAMP